MNKNYSDFVKNEIDKNNSWFTGSHFEWAEKTEVKRIYNGRMQFICRIIQENLSSEQNKLLDVGCGDGYWLNRIYNDFNNEIYLKGIDYNHLRIERAKTILPKTIELINANAFEFSEKEYDFVLNMHVIEHISNDLIFLEKLSSFLKHGGHLILGTPNEGNFFMQIRNWKRNIYSSTDHKHFYLEPIITNRIRSKGFEIKKIYRDPFYFISDRLFYNVLKKQIGYNFLKFLSQRFKYFSSGYIFHCIKK